MKARQAVTKNEMIDNMVKNWTRARDRYLKEVALDQYYLVDMFIEHLKDLKAESEASGD